MREKTLTTIAPEPLEKGRSGPESDAGTARHQRRIRASRDTETAPPLCFFERP
jgi:hypothetical protein